LVKKIKVNGAVALK